MTGISRFIAIIEVISDPFQDTSPIWSDEDFPCRLKVKIIVELSPETSVPVHEVKDHLSFFRNLNGRAPMHGLGTSEHRQQRGCPI